MASFGDTDWKPEYDDADDKEKTRLIGVELEAKIKEPNEMPDDEFEFLAEDWLNEEGIASYENDYDDEEEVDYDMRADWVYEKLEEKGLELGGVGYDGGGKEFVTHPDSITLWKKGGTERAKKLIDVLNKYTIADSASGTHINISKLESDHDNTMSNLYWMSMVFGTQIQKVFGRRSRWARIPLPINCFSTLDNTTRIYRSPVRRPSFKGIHFDNKGTIIVNKGNRYEFRGPKSSNDICEIIAWVEFCNNMLEYCSKQTIKDVQFSELLKGEHIQQYVLGFKGDRQLIYSDREMIIGKTGYVAITDIDKRFD